MQVGKALKNKSLLKVPLNLQTKNIYNSFITVDQNHFCIVNDYLLSPYFVRTGGEVQVGSNLIKSLSLRILQRNWDPAGPGLYIY